MSDNKKYYWLKLKADFFEDDTISWIEEQENGKDYVLFYLKLVLKSLSEEGYLIRYVGEKLIPYDVATLAKITNTASDTVKVAMNLFLEIGLISTLETGEIYINQIEEMIGIETESAKRVRKHRAKKALEEEKNMLLHCNTNVIKCNTEIEIEIEREIELEKEIESTPKSVNNFTKIIEKWNSLNLQELKTINPNTNRHLLLNARLKEYSLEDFIKAMDNIDNSDFLKGQNDKGWAITFDWLIKPNNFIKVLEGNYNNKSNKSTTKKGYYSIKNNITNGADEQKAIQDLIAKRLGG